MQTTEDDFKKVIATHLGKAGDGSVVAPYKTPDKHDKTLLVPMPREYHRTKNNITPEFYGFEVWHAYEMSFLNKNGMPSTGILKLSYPATSTSIVESKSLKLYLNSFDLEKFDSKTQVENIIATDLTEALGGKVQVKLHLAHEANFEPMFKSMFTNVDNMKIFISEYKENPDLLEEDYISVGKELTFHTANLRSNCEITNQKDTGNCYIFMEGKKLPTIESLTRYIISMRDSQHFHENVTEIVYNTLMTKFNPKKLFVANIYNRRGGIDLHCIRSTSKQLIDVMMNKYDNVKILHSKTPQQ